MEIFTITEAIVCLYLRKFHKVITNFCFYLWIFLKIKIEFNRPGNLKNPGNILPHGVIWVNTTNFGSIGRLLDTNKLTAKFIYFFN